MMNSVKKIIAVIIYLVFMFTLIISFNLLSNREKNCDEYNVEDCPSRCVVCPPCPECSSIKCQTTEKCQEYGFDKDWYRIVRSQNIQDKS